MSLRSVIGETRLWATLFFTLALTPLAIAQDSLRFDNNWFVTGDYVTAGVALRGKGVLDTATGLSLATGSIAVPQLPANAEPIAAFLYWSTVEITTTPSASDGWFNGYQIRGAYLGNSLTNPGCGSAGGTIGPGTYGRAYRADVLRYFPVGAGGIRDVNSVPATVQLRDSGGNGKGQLLYTNGATLLIIYRIVSPGNTSAAPLRAVVAYDGAFTMAKDSSVSPAFNLAVAGFYQASSAPAAKLTFIVANGQSAADAPPNGMLAPLLVNGIAEGDGRFLGALGAFWDSPTISFDLASGAASFPTSVTLGAEKTCLTFAAVIASMNVQDSDGDGLLDTWETNGLHRNNHASPATFGGCSEFPTEPCVDLPKMGAQNGTKDIFVQIDWMHGAGDSTGGLDGLGTHGHKPKLESLSAVCSTFASHGIALHFDVGNNYQTGSWVNGVWANGNACIVPYQDVSGKVLAEGGSDLAESSLLCTGTSSHPCVYQTPYPVLSFGFGFASVRDGNTRAGIAPHFAQARKDTHHYSLFAHALAGPFDRSGRPVDPYTSAPLASPPTPRSYSGIANRPGGGFMVTLGLWRSDVPENDQVGSALVQAGTLMHELGHNLSLGHAGLSTKPNCIPTYPSVMNYAYQTRGLTDASGAPHIDFSLGSLSLLNEGFLSASDSLGSLPYRLRYFGPPPPGTPTNSLAKTHCDGTPILYGEQAIRSQAADVGTPQWSNGTAGYPFSFDVNFDGVGGQVFRDQPDWSSLNLLQIGSGAFFGSLSVGAFATDGGALATDGGALATDGGALATDGGAFATDGGAFATDGGAFATDGGAFATDGGALATDGGALATDAGDEDYDSHVASGPEPPTVLTASPEVNDILLSWNPPDSSKAASYDVYRCAGAVCTWVSTGFTPASKPHPQFTDVMTSMPLPGSPCSTCYNTQYTYQVLANVSAVVGGAVVVTASPLSNTASALVKHWWVTADDKSRVYGASNPAFTFAVAGYDSTGGTGVTCTTTAGPSSPVGTYPITCRAGAGTPAGVTYVSGTLTVTPATPAVAVSGGPFSYDGTAKSATCTVMGIGGAILGGGDGSCALSYTDSSSNPVAGPTKPGTYGVTASFTSSNENYGGATGIGSLVIGKGASAVAVSFGLGPYVYRNGYFLATASVSGAGTGIDPAALTITYSGTSVDATGRCIYAGNCTATATYPGDANHNGSANSASITITQDSADCPMQNGISTCYTGQIYAWTPTSSSNSATILLSATIVDSTINTPGDIRTARVSFGIRQAGGGVSAISSASNLAVGPVSGDTSTSPTVGSASASAQFSLNGGDFCSTFTIVVMVGGNYNMPTPAWQDTLITVCKATTGAIASNPRVDVSNDGSGGYLADGSHGISQVTFAVSYNKAQTNAQGKVQIQIKSDHDSTGRVDGKTHTYVITSNSITSLNVTGKKGDFAAKCNVVEEVSNPDTNTVTVVSLDGGATISLSLDADRQTIGFTVNKNKNIGGMWFSSNWDGVKTVDKAAANALSKPINVM